MPFTPCRYLQAAAPGSRFPIPRERASSVGISIRVSGSDDVRRQSTPRLFERCVSPRGSEARAVRDDWVRTCALPFAQRPL